MTFEFQISTEEKMDSSHTLGYAALLFIVVVVPLLICYAIRWDHRHRIRFGDTVRLRHNWKRRSGDPRQGINYFVYSSERGIVRISGFSAAFGKSMFVKVKARSLS